MSMFDDVLGMGRTSSIMEGALEPEVEEITMESVEDMPSYMDPMEFMTQVACEQEMNMQRLDMAILGEEYMYLRENGEEITNEAASIQGVVDKFKKGIDWLWEHITKFFKEVQKKVEEALKLDDRFLSAYAEKAKKVEKVSINTVFHSIEGLDCKTTYSQANKYFGDITKQVTAIYNRIESIGKDETYESIKNDAVRAVFGNNSNYKDESFTAKTVMKAFLQDKNGKSETNKPADRSFNVAKLIETFKGSRAQKNLLKSAYNDNKKAISQMYKGAKKLESLAKKHKVLSADASKRIHIGVKVINSLGKDLTIVNKNMVKVMNIQRSTMKKGIVKAASMGSDKIQNAMKAAAGESASLIESVQIGGEW